MHRNQVAVSQRKDRDRSGLAFAAGVVGNGRDRKVFTWRDRALAEAVALCDPSADLRLVGSDAIRAIANLIPRES